MSIEQIHPQLTLTQRFAILALNGLPIMKMSALKKERLHGILCAQFFELLFSGHIQEDHGSYELVPFISEVPTTVSFLAHYHKKKLTIRQWIHLLSTADRRILEDFENAVTIHLITKRQLDEVSDLSECDLMHNPSGTTVSKYRSNHAAFLQEYQRLRVFLEISGFDDIPKELLVLYWLMEQTFLSESLFLPDELATMRKSRASLCWQNKFAKKLFKLSLDHSAHNRSQKLASFLGQLLDSKIGSLLIDLFPSLQPRETVFIPSERYCKSPESRLEFALRYLKERGHHCSLLYPGDCPVIEVDNIPYKLISRKITMNEEAIPGVQLLPHP